MKHLGRVLGVFVSGRRGRLLCPRRRRWYLGDAALKLRNQGVEALRRRLVVVVARLGLRLEHRVHDEPARAVQQRRETREGVEGVEEAVGGHEGRWTGGFGEELGVRDDGGTVSTCSYRCCFFCC